MEVNERSIKITGTANIPEDLTNGKEYALTISAAEVRTVSDTPTDDGKINRTFTLKLSNFSEVNFISEREVVKGSAKGKQSVALRRAIENLFDINQPEGFDKESYYQHRMSKIIDEVNRENN